MQHLERSGCRKDWKEGSWRHREAPPLGEELCFKAQVRRGSRCWRQVWGRQVLCRCVTLEYNCAWKWPSREGETGAPGQRRNDCRRNISEYVREVGISYTSREAEHPM